MKGKLLRRRGGRREVRTEGRQGERVSDGGEEVGVERQRE